MAKPSDKMAIQTHLFNKPSSKVLNTLRSQGSVKKLAPGEVLTKQGENTDIINIIISGKIKIIKKIHGKLIMFAHLGRGDWVGELTFPMDKDNTSSAVASEDSIVIKINKEAIESFEKDFQLLFYKQVNQLSFLRMGQFEEIKSKIEQKNKRLVDDIYVQRSQAKTDFRHMEMIRGIIKKVPRLPIFATTLSTKLLDDKLSAGELADEIMKDPSLVAIVLKTINSAYYGFEKKISDMRYAIVLLGFDMMYQLVIAEGVKRTMPDTPVFKELHTHSVIISHLAFTLSQESKVGNPSEMATIGLLHDLGQTVIQLLKDKNPKFSMFISVLDQAQMGALLLKTWNLPDIIWQSVEFQFYPEFSFPENIPVETRNNVTVLFLSHICYDFLRGLPEQKMPLTFADNYLQLLNFGGHSIKEIVEENLLPALTQKIKTFPTPVRQLLKKHL